MTSENSTTVPAAPLAEDAAAPLAINGAAENDALEKPGITRHAVQVGPISFLIPQNIVSEVVDNARYCRLPGSPSFLLGMGSVRAITFPVFDMHYLCGVETTESPVTLLMNFETGPAAITIDHLPKIVQISEEQKTETLPPLRQSLKNYIAAAYQAEELCVELNFIDFFESSSN